MTRLFRRFSLQQRFLVAPLLGLVVCILLAAAFIYESQRQHTLLSRITERDFTAFNRYSAVFVNLTEQHTALYDLLYGAGTMDEATLYDRAKQHLQNVQQAADELDRALSPMGQSAAADIAAHRGELLADAQAYRRGISAAVGMATANLALATGQLALANKQFAALNHSFVRFLDSQRAAISSEIAERVRRSKISSTTIAVVGISFAALLFFLSQVLSRILARSIEAQIGILTDLGSEAGADLADNDSDEVERMTRAIAAFRRTLLDLRHSRDALERRVLERTQELRQANDGLRSEVELRTETEQALRLFTDNVPAMTVSIDANLRYRFVNKGYADFFGRDAADIVGRHLREVVGEETFCEIEDHFAQALQGHPVIYRRTRKLANGETGHLEVKLLPHIGDQGKVLGCFAMTTDITQHKLAEERIQRVAHHDSLTGLPNRLLFTDRLNQALSRARRNAFQCGLLYLDLDKFKPVNDTLGHSAGDELLQAVAARISRRVRESDTVARVGGDEFAVILTEIAGRAQAETVASKIVAALATPFQLGSQKHSVDIGASIGIALYPADGVDADALVKAADAAMYSAKQAGNSYRFCAA